MRSLRIYKRGISSAIFILSLVLFVSLFLGHVLGSFYLVNMTEEGSYTITEKSNTGEENGKKIKVLRLNQTNSYSILITSSDKRETALLVAREMGKKGFPVIVTGQAPYKVLMGFCGKEEKLAVLANRIRVGNEGAKVICEQLNKEAFKFAADDSYAEKEVAPFLGKVSLCLEKALALYDDAGVSGQEAAVLKAKISILAKSVEELAGEKLTSTEDKYKYLSTLSERAEQWAVSLRRLETNLTDSNFMESQQKALVLNEEYHYFLMNQKEYKN